MDWQAESAEAWWDATRDTSRMLATLLERLTPAEVAALRERARGAPAGVRGGRRLAQRPGIARVVLAVPARGGR